MKIGGQVSDVGGETRQTEVVETDPLRQVCWQETSSECGPFGKHTEFLPPLRCFSIFLFSTPQAGI